MGIDATYNFLFLRTCFFGGRWHLIFKFFFIFNVFFTILKFVLSDFIGFLLKHIYKNIFFFNVLLYIIIKYNLYIGPYEHRK